MKTIPTFSFCLFLCLGNIAISQNTDNLKTINSEIWTNFTKAFDELDYELFSSLHSNDLIRVASGGKSVRGKNEYLNRYKKHWKNKTLKQTISFRFLERISNNDTASERGIYKLTQHLNTLNEKSYYGKFHVILKKEKNVWKILVDYDSSENNTINEVSYQNGFNMEDFEKYKK